MNNKTSRTLLAAGLALAGLGAAQAQTVPANYGYWVDSSNRIVKNTWGECWRVNANWKPELAVAECDPALVPKPVAVPAPVAAPAPAPVAAPAPVVAPTPAPAPAPVFRTSITEKAVRLEGANFATGSSRLLAGASAKLNEVVQAAREYPEMDLTVSGHTDSSGNASLNQALSRDRAAAVKTYLVGQGVAAERIRTEGFGSQQPVADNRTAAGRAQNRRVEIRYTIREETRVRVTP